MKPLYILKLGGSVVTYKNKSGMAIRKTLVKKIARELKKLVEKNKFQLILIHGAGSPGHKLAHKYKLKDGAKKDSKKWHGSFLSRIINSKLNNILTEIMIKEGLRVTPIHTASVIIHKNKKINKFNLITIEEALKQNCIPMLYGEMVFDETLGMSVCSGDAIAPHLAKKFKAKKIFFASDIDGIFNKDPHLNEKAILIKNIKLKNIKKDIKLSKSHNIDVSDGLLGKITKIKDLKNSQIEKIEVFSGLNHKNFSKVFLNQKFNHTIIEI